MDSKKCSRCKVTKKIEEFWRLTNSKDGRDSYCIACKKKMSQMPGIRLSKYKYALAWSKRNKEKVRAHFIIRDLKKYGKLVEEPCVVCGKIEVQAHHIDYDYPKGIIWVCTKHHRMAHKMILA